MTPEAEQAWPALPTETEIYILPTGEIVVADLPAELAGLMAHLTRTATVEVQLQESNPDDVSNQQHPAQPTHPG